MKVSESLKQSAEKIGISLSHYDIDGHLIYAPPDTVRYFTELLQPPNNRHINKGAFHDVFAAFENEPIHYDLIRLSLTDASSLHCSILDERGKKCFEQTFSSPQSLVLPLLPFGYYQLLLASAEQQFTVRLLVTPRTAYQPDVLKNKKAWGINVQLYSLRSKTNWGIGDFGDLTYLIEQGAKQGADFIGINPLHMLYPNNTFKTDRT